MSIKYIVIIALAAAALSSIGCAEAEQKRENPTELAPAPESVLTSTVTAAKPKPVQAAEPVLVAEPEAKLVAAEPEANDAPLEPTTESVDGVTIQRFSTTSEIEKREPVDPRSMFGPEHEKVYAFVEVSNESESDKSLFVHFIGPKGKVSGGIELEIPASVPRWRTWAYTRHFDAPGLWRVEIRDEDGSLLGALPFEVEAAH